MIKNWTVVSTHRYSTNGSILSVFKDFVFALEYAAFVTYHDKEYLYLGWTTFVVEGDFLNV